MAMAMSLLIVDSRFLEHNNLKQNEICLLTETPCSYPQQKGVKHSPKTVFGVSVLHLISLNNVNTIKA